MIDDSGTARLDTVDRNSILAVLDISVNIPMNADGYIREYRYSAPEVMPPNASSAHKTRKESDVYGMGMIVYEASSCYIVQPEGQISCKFLGLDGGRAVLQAH